MRIFIKYFVFLALCFMLYVTGLMIAAPAASASTIVPSTISANTTWAPAGNPYIINAITTVNSGVTLTIGPGVIVKFQPATHLNIYGTLNADGTAPEKIYFTSIKDDSVGGDTNGDGSATSPAKRDWTAIYTYSGSTANFDNVVITYSGGGCDICNGAGIFNSGSWLTVSNSKIAHNDQYGIYSISSAVNVTGTEITDQTNGIYVQSIGNYFNISQSSIHDNSSYGVNNTTREITNASSNWWGDASGPYNYDNPAGLGNPVSNYINYSFWLLEPPVLNGDTGVTPPKPPDPVIIIPGILGSSDKNGVWVLDPIFHTYDDLVETLKANGYREGVDLFTFPYDWRQSNVITAIQLRDKINEVQASCQCAKVDLVAHSMGGLVARQYIQSDKYENDVDQLIFLGTPHLGAPKSYLMWEGGDVGGTKLIDQGLQFFLSREAKKAGFSNLFDYIRNKPIPSVQELLPGYDYLRDKDSGVLRTYSNNYPQNTFLENLKTTVANLFDKGINITNIVGELAATSTISTIRVISSPNLPLWENGYPDGFDGSTPDKGLERGAGDGTVPLNSSEFISNDLNKLDSEHSALVTKAEGLVFKKLTGKDASTLITSNTDSIFDVNFKMFMIKILSPVDVIVTAPDGKRIGKDFGTNSEVNEISGAFYSGFLTDDEYVTIPNPLDGEYKIETQGTGTGEYTVATGLISDGTSQEQDFVSQTSPGLVETVNVQVDGTKPVITILSPENKDYLRSALLPINIDIQDPGTGVASSSITFDGKIISNGGAIDLFFGALGWHKVAVSAEDFAGNIANAETLFRVIATAQSTISDIDHAYTLGWINKKSVHDALVSKLQKPVTPRSIKSFLDYLERNHPKYINDQAYNLLKEDANWMLSN